MKNKRYLTIVILLILALMLSASPVSAGAEKLPVSGTCILIAFPPYFGNIDQNPDYRYWINLHGVAHWRNQAILFACDFDDDRLDGYFLITDNWNYNVNEQSRFIARSFGSKGGFMSDELGNDLGLWDGTGVGYTEADGTWSAQTIWKGRGMYQGLLAKTTWTSLEFPFYAIEGELLVPGN